MGEPDTTLHKANDAAHTVARAALAERDFMRFSVKAFASSPLEGPSFLASASQGWDRHFDALSKALDEYEQAIAEANIEEI